MNVKVDCRLFEKDSTQQFHHQGAMPQQACKAGRSTRSAGKLAGDVPRISSWFLIYEAGSKNWSTSYGV